MKKLTKLDDLQPDPENLNEGTERGSALLEESIDRYGYGRSIVVDKNGVAIAGNKTLERAAERGAKIQVVETDGNTLVVVQRKDLDLMTDDRAVGLAIADNRVGEVNLNWNPVLVEEKMDSHPAELSVFFTTEELGEIIESEGEEGDGDEGDEMERLDLDLPEDAGESEGDSGPGREYGFPLAIVLPSHQLFTDWQGIKRKLEKSDDTAALIELMTIFMVNT